MANDDTFVRALWNDLRRWLAPGGIALSLAFLTPPPPLAAIFVESTSAAVQPLRIRELVIVNRRVADYQTLVDDLVRQRAQSRAVEVVLLDSDRSGVEQISDTLASWHDVTAAHIISHGAAGAVDVGSTRLDSRTLLGHGSAWVTTNEPTPVRPKERGVPAGIGLLLLVALIAGGHWPRTLVWLRVLIGATLLTCAPRDLLAAPAVDATRTGTTTGSSVTISHTATSASDRLMLVGVSMANPSSRTVSSVTRSGVSLTLVGTVAKGSNEARVEIWPLIAPATDTHGVVMTFSGANQATVGVMTCTGVDQSSPLRRCASASGDSSAPSVNVGSASGELVFDVLCIVPPLAGGHRPAARRGEERKA